MADGQLKPVAALLLILNFFMFVVVLGIGGWAMNRAIDHGFIIGPGFDLPAHFSPIYFPMGNAATGFFVVFALIASVVGVASVIAGFNHIRFWHTSSLPSAASAATIAWSLTLLAIKTNTKSVDTTHLERKISLLQEEIKDLKKIVDSFHNETMQKVLKIVESIDSVVTKIPS